jgi:hypothetical protein
VGNYSRDGQSTEDNIAHAHSMRKPKGTNINSEYVILIALPLKQ